MNLSDGKSPFADSELARRIAATCYEQEPEVELITQHSNAVFRLRFPDRSKILKLSKQLDNPLIRKELMLIALLHKQDIPVPSVEHADETGTLFGKPFFIMDSAGEQVVSYYLSKPPKLAYPLFAEMGSTLAKIHNITVSTSGYIWSSGIAPHNTETYWQSAYCQADWAIAQGVLNTDEVAVLKSLTLPTVDGLALCHGDFHPSQCVARDGKITAVVDWQGSWVGNCAIDLAIAHAYLDYYCSPELIKCFFVGYTSKRSLPSGYQLTYLPVRMLQSLAILRNWHNQGNPDYVERAVKQYRAYCRLLGQWSNKR